jgi:beta-aspartyl-dipeptidase (metallo-type)
VPPVPLSRFTRAGVTTVVGVLGTDDLIRTPGEVVAAARGLEVEGISAWCHTGGYHLPPATITGSVRGDIVHIDRVIGVGRWRSATTGPASRRSTSWRASARRRTWAG